MALVTGVGGPGARRGASGSARRNRGGRTGPPGENWSDVSTPPASSVRSRNEQGGGATAARGPDEAEGQGRLLPFPIARWRPTELALPRVQVRGDGQGRATAAATLGRGQVQVAGDGSCPVRLQQARRFGGVGVHAATLPPGRKRSCPGRGCRGVAVRGG